MAAALRFALLATALAVVLAQTPVEDTTGKSVSVATDYTFNSNVGGYLKFSEDVCAIKPLLASGDWAGAKQIYSKGRSDYVTSETQRTLQGVAVGTHPDEPTWSLYNRYFAARNEEDVFVDAFIVNALDGNAPFTSDARRRESAEKGMQNVLQTVYLLHELDEAAAKINASNLSPTSGAPNNIDETFAIYVGKDIDCSPWGTAEKRAIEFGTRASCSRSEVNADMVQQFNAARTAATAGDLPAFNAAVTQIKRNLVLTHLQNAIKYSALAEQDLAAGRSIDENQAEGYAFFRTIEPLAAQAQPTATATIVRIMTPGANFVTGDAARVATAAGQIAARFNITAAEIGSLGATQNLNCPGATSSATSTAASILASAVVAGAVLALTL